MAAGVAAGMRSPHFARTFLSSITVGSLMALSNCEFGRWSLLGAGILYGIYHQNRLAKREVGIREIEAKEKILRDQKLAEEKKRIYEAEVKMLEEMSK